MLDSPHDAQNGAKALPRVSPPASPGGHTAAPGGTPATADCQSWEHDALAVAVVAREAPSVDDLVAFLEGQEMRLMRQVSARSTPVGLRATCNRTLASNRTSASLTKDLGVEGPCVCAEFASVRTPRRGWSGANGCTYQKRSTKARKPRLMHRHVHLCVSRYAAQVVLSHNDSSEALVGSALSVGVGGGAAPTLHHVHEQLMSVVAHRQQQQQQNQRQRLQDAGGVTASRSNSGAPAVALVLTGDGRSTDSGPALPREGAVLALGAQGSGSLDGAQRGVLDAASRMRSHQGSDADTVSLCLRVAPALLGIGALPGPSVCAQQALPHLSSCAC